MRTTVAATPRESAVLAFAAMLAGASTRAPLAPAPPSRSAPRARPPADAPAAPTTRRARRKQTPRSRRRRRRRRAARRRGGARRAPRRGAPGRPPPRAGPRPRGATALSADLGTHPARTRGRAWGAMVVSLTRGDTLFARDADAAAAAGVDDEDVHGGARARPARARTGSFSTDVLRDGAVGADGTLQRQPRTCAATATRRSRALGPAGATLDAPMHAARRARRGRGREARDGRPRRRRDRLRGAHASPRAGCRATPAPATRRRSPRSRSTRTSSSSRCTPDGRVAARAGDDGHPRAEHRARHARGGAARRCASHRATDGHVVARGYDRPRAPVRARYSSWCRIRRRSPPARSAPRSRRAAITVDGAAPRRRDAAGDADASRRSSRRRSRELRRGDEPREHQPLRGADLPQRGARPAARRRWARRRTATRCCSDFLREKAGAPPDAVHGRPTAAGSRRSTA